MRTGDDAEGTRGPMVPEFAAEAFRIAAGALRSCISSRHSLYRYKYRYSYRYRKRCKEREREDLQGIELAADDGREGALALVKAPLGDLHHLLFNSMSAIRAYSILFQGTM